MESDNSWRCTTSEAPVSEVVLGQINEGIHTRSVMTSMPRGGDLSESMRIRTPATSTIIPDETRLPVGSLPRTRDTQPASEVIKNPCSLREVTSVLQLGIADCPSPPLPSGVQMIGLDRYHFTTAIGQSLMTSSVVPTSKVRRSDRIRSRDPVFYRIDSLPHRKKTPKAYLPLTSEELAPQGREHAIVHLF